MNKNAAIKFAEGYNAKVQQVNSNAPDNGKVPFRTSSSAYNGHEAARAMILAGQVTEQPVTLTTITADQAEQTRDAWNAMYVPGGVFDHRS